MFKNITLDDLKVIKAFSIAMANIDPHMPKKRQILYAHSIYRNMFRVGYENRFDQNTWENFISLCRADKNIERLHNERKMAAVRETYGYMIEKIAGQMGLQLKRIDRTVSEARLVLTKTTQPQSASPIFFQT